MDVGQHGWATPVQPVICTNAPCHERALYFNSTFRCCLCTINFTLLSSAKPAPSDGRSLRAESGQGADRRNQKLTFFYPSLFSVWLRKGGCVQALNSSPQTPFFVSGFLYPNVEWMRNNFKTNSFSILNSPQFFPPNFCFSTNAT